MSNILQVQLQALLVGVCLSMPATAHEVVPVTDLPNLATLTLRASCNSSSHILSWNDVSGVPEMRNVSDAAVRAATFRIWKMPKFPWPLDAVGEPVTKDRQEFVDRQSRGLRVHEGDQVQLSLLETPATGAEHADITHTDPETLELPQDKLWLTIGPAASANAARRVRLGIPPDHTPGQPNPNAWHRPASVANHDYRFLVRGIGSTAGRRLALGVGAEVTLQAPNAGARISVSTNCGVSVVPIVQPFDPVSEVPLILGSHFSDSELPAFAIRSDRWTESDFRYGVYMVPAPEYAFSADTMRFASIGGRASIRTTVPPLMKSQIGWCLSDSGQPPLHKRLYTSHLIEPVKLRKRDQFIVEGAARFVMPNPESPSSAVNMFTMIDTPFVDTFAREGLKLPETFLVPTGNVYLCGSEIHVTEPTSAAAASNLITNEIQRNLVALKIEVSRLNTLSLEQRSALVQLMQQMVGILGAGANP